MATPNPDIQKALELAKAELAELRAEKARLYPPNPHPLAQADTYPQGYTAEQIAQHNALDAQIEMLEQRVDDLQLRLYSK